MARIRKVLETTKFISFKPAADHKMTEALTRLKATLNFMYDPEFDSDEAYRQALPQNGIRNIYNPVYRRMLQIVPEDLTSRRKFALTPARYGLLSFPRKRVA